MSSYIEFGIFLTLLDGKTHKAAEFANKYEISTKTVYRHINKLVYAGFPITTFTGKNGGITLISDYKIDTWFFSDTELAHLLNLVNSEKSLSPEYYETIAEKIKRQTLKQSSKSALIDKFFIDSNCWFTNLSKKTKLDYQNTLRACEKHKQMEILYNGSKSPRVIDPYCIVKKENDFYIYAYCNVREDFRLFKISRIDSYKILEEEFNLKEINLTKQPWNNTSFERISITAQMNSNLAKEISSWTTVEKIDETTYKFCATNNIGLVHKLMQYGNQIKVLKPQNLARSMLAECQSIANLYNSNQII